MGRDAYRLKPWTEVVRPHEDILAGRLEMSTYAADLGAVDRGDPATPRVYRDADEFFRTTFLTVKLRQLVEDVLTVLSGGAGDRVLQLRTPFGGGKTHAMLALYHLLKSRDAIASLDVASLPNPGTGRVAVLSGLDLDPWAPRVVDGLPIRTLWGELAYRIGGQQGLERVRIQDDKGSPPGNDVLRPILEGGPVLVLLDEVLVYVQRAGGREGNDPYRKQVMNFLQGLTELVRGMPNAAMVYSLQASEHEAAGDVALLGDLDHLVTRVDAKRQPVDDDEVMRVVRRRLFPEFGLSPEHEAMAKETAREYALAFSNLMESTAETAADRRAVTIDAERFEHRVLDSYPFHPELLDLMYHRWGSLPSYQRTRGALQFLASIVSATWDQVRLPRPLIGPGDVPLEEERVQGTFFSQVGERERYSSVLAADITGPDARAQEADRRIGGASPIFDQLKVGTRAATAVMLYSFGARQGEERGVVEGDLVEALVSPELDRNVITTTLVDLREELLYLHHIGRRYRFEPKANLNLLIAEERKKFQPDEVLEHVKTTLAEALRGAGDGAVLWPPDGRAIQDGTSTFRVVYLGEEWAALLGDGRIDDVAELVERCGATRREQQNALAFALPTPETLDRARTAARTEMALGEVLKQAKAYDLGDEQVSELRDRERATTAELKGTVERMYESVLVPVADRNGERAFRFDTIDLRAQLTAGRGLHDRIIDGLRKHVFESVTPARIAALTKLGTERQFVACEDLAKWFFSYFDFPKLLSASPIRAAVARGVADVFGYVPAADVVEETLRPRRDKTVWFGSPLDEEDVEMGPDAYILAPELATALQPATPRSDRTDGPITVEAPTAGASASVPQRSVQGEGEPTHASIRTTAGSAEQLFRLMPGLQNLADRSKRIVVRLDIDADASDSYERSWFRNAVKEHLDEAGVQSDFDLS
jgi:Protein of unknown function (DUF499)